MRYTNFPRVLPGLLLVLASAPASAYHLASEIKVAGDGGWDYLTFDAPGARLFVSHGTRVEVLDAQKLKIVGTIENTPGVHGVALAQDLNRGYVSAGASNSVVVFDLKTLARVAEIKTGDNPDAILYEESTHRVFTFNGRGRNVTVIDANRNEVIGTIAVDAKPEFAVSDGAGRIYVNLEDRNSLAVLDARSMKLLKTWPLAGCEEPTGLAFDAAHERLFSVCSNRVMAVLDARDGREVARLSIGDHVDGAGFDAALGIAFASCGDGTLTVVKELNPEKFVVDESVATKAGARTMTLDQTSHRVFLSTAQRGSAHAVVPDTFEVLVVVP